MGKFSYRTISKISGAIFGTSAVTKKILPLLTHFSRMEYFALYNREMIVREDGAPLSGEDLDRLGSCIEVNGRFREEATGIEALAFTKNAVIPEGYRKILIRESFATMGTEEAFRLARAKALLEWRANTRYCGRCGSLLKEHDSLTARICPDCGNLIFPRIEPCIIVLVHRDDQILLARHVQRNQDIYACIAGFMEAGESAEHAVAREIYEETGIRVKNIRYFGSQSWPFPSQLMLGFTAEYESGDMKLQDDEISEARWFRRDECPASPAPGSIAYRLIHETVFGRT